MAKRAYRADCVQHVMQSGVSEGWYVCVRCGLVALCPGCLEGMRLPEGVWFHLCEQHQWLANAQEGLAGRVVWNWRA